MNFTTSLDTEIAPSCIASKGRSIATCTFDTIGEDTVFNNEFSVQLVVVFVCQGNRNQVGAQGRIFQDTPECQSYDSRVSNFVEVRYLDTEDLVWVEAQNCSGVGSVVAFGQAICVARSLCAEGNCIVL